MARGHHAAGLASEVVVGSKKQKGWEQAPTTDESGPFFGGITEDYVICDPRTYLHGCKVNICGLTGGSQHL
jgi:hypothetical protein